MEVTTGIIFDIKRYAIHDGPGIRTTVFFKGCPLNCTWCHNPEGIKEEPEVILRPNRCDPDCTACISVCPHEAITKKNSEIRINKSKCDLCGKCGDICVYEAVEMAGKKVTDLEVLNEVLKDSLFYEDSSGGVTLSGGEPTIQPKFLKALLKRFRQKNISTILDTSGFAPFEIFEDIQRDVDLFLYDLKVMDDDKHRKFTGVSNKLILENLRRLSRNGSKVIARIPLIPGVNEDEKNLKETVDFLKSVGNIHRVNILPFHKSWCEKYKALNQEEPKISFKPISDTQQEEIRSYMAGFGFDVKIGG
jgi:pyruvate formate lyase activating enzyme